MNSIDLIYAVLGFGAGWIAGITIGVIMGIGKNDYIKDGGGLWR